MACMDSGADGHMSIIFVGQSMYPLLRDLDILYIAPCRGEDLKRGDVIVFNSDDGRDVSVAHRIISVAGGRYRTRGDNNAFPDERLVPPESVIGRVTHAKRGGRTIEVRGGRAGEMLAGIVAMRYRARTAILRPLVFPYHWLSRSGLFRKLIPRSMKRRIVNIQRPEGIESQLLLGDRIVGRRKAGNTRWSILPPFKLFIDEASLPGATGRLNMKKSN